MTSIYFIEKKYLEFLKLKYRKNIQGKKVYVYGLGQVCDFYVTPILGEFIHGFIDNNPLIKKYHGKSVCSLEKAMDDADIIFLGSNKNSETLFSNVRQVSSSVQIMHFENKEIAFLDRIEECFARKVAIDLIPGLQDIEDLEAIFHLAKNVLTKNPHAYMCELGSWKGGSALVIAAAIKMYGNKGAKLMCIDTWEAPDDTSETNALLCQEAQSTDVQSIFKANITHMMFDGVVETICGNSHDVANHFDDHTFDLIFIDADHRYSFIRDDLKNMAPKVKKNGLFMGHDCLGHLKDFPLDLIDEYLEKDCILFENKPLHAGVVKACDEFFKSHHHIFPSSRVWYFSENNQLLTSVSQAREYIPITFSTLSCPICGANAYLHYVNRSRYRLYRCIQCTHIFVSNVPTKEALALMYQDNTMYLSQNYHTNYEHLVPHVLLSSDSFIKDRMNELLPHVPDLEVKNKPKRILEIGCLDGRILAYLKTLGHDVYGVDLNKSVAQQSSHYYDFPIQTNPLEMCEFEENSFDIIYSFHTLEHLDDVYSYYKRSFKLLKTNGILLTHIPYEEIDYGNKDHLHIFSEKSISLLHKKWFDNIKISKSTIVTNCNLISPVLTISSIKKTII